MPRRVIDTTVVEIVPSFPGFEQRVEREVDRALDDIVDTADRATDDMAQEFARLERDINEVFNDIATSGEVDMERLTDVAERTARAIHGDYERNLEASESAFDELRRSAQRDMEQVAASAAVAGASTRKSFGAAGLAGAAALGGIGIAAVAGLGAIAGLGLSSAASLEQVQISFNALLGSAEKGEEMFRSLQKFAALTPFEFPEVAAAAKRFFAFNQQVGLTDDQIQDVLTTVGDLASVTGAGAEGLNRIFLALSQIAGKGTLQLEELRQIGEAVPGFSAVDAIAKQLGITTAETLDMISAGSIDATTGIQALLVGMQEFPGAAGAMEKQSQTLLGVFSTFKDTVGQALADAFTPVIPAIKDALTSLTPIIGEALQAFVPALGSLLANLLPIIGSLVRAAGPLLGALLTLLDAILKPLIPVIDQVVGALAGPLEEVIVALTPVFVELVKPLGDLLLALIPLIPPILDLVVALAPLAVLIVKLLSAILGFLTVEAIVPIVGLLVQGLNLLVGVIEDLVGWIGRIDWGEVGNDIAGAFSDAWNAVKNFFVGIGRFFRDLPGNILNFIKSLPQRFVTLIKTMFDMALQAIGVGIGLILAFFIKSPGLVLDALKALPGLLADFFAFVFDDVTDRIAAGWNNIIEFAKSVPNRIGLAIGALIGTVVSVFTKVREKGEGIFSQMVNTIVGFFLALPGRLLGFATNLGVDIFNGFKRLLNSAISSINTGIAKVDAFIPGDLPRLPLLAQGGVTSSPAIIGEAGTEAAIPLTDNRAMNALVNAFTRAGGGDGPIINQTVIVEIDGQQLQGRIVRTITEHDRTLKQRVTSRRGRR